MSFSDLIGLLGVVLGVYCYARLQWHRDFAKTMEYSALNFLSSCLMIISLVHNWNLAAFVSNAVWCVLSLYGLYRCSKYLKMRAQGAAPVVSEPLK